MDLSRYCSAETLKKEDFQQPRTWTIEKFSEHEFRDERTGDSERKALVKFAESQSWLVLNKTNSRLLIVLLRTTDTDRMVGQKVELYNDASVQMGGRAVGGIRLRLPPERPAAGADGNPF